MMIEKPPTQTEKSQTEKEKANLDFADKFGVHIKQTIIAAHDRKAVIGMAQSNSVHRDRKLKSTIETICWGMKGRITTAAAYMSRR